MPSLKLFRGRTRLDEQLEDGGEPGPTFGPSPYFHATYGNEIKFDKRDGRLLRIVGDLAYSDGTCYGDWFDFDEPPSDEDRQRLTTFDPKLAEVPESFLPSVGREPSTSTAEYLASSRAWRMVDSFPMPRSNGTE